MLTQQQNKMDKQITLNLTDLEYRKLIEMFHLGYFDQDSITDKSSQEINQEMDMMQKISKQAHDCGSKNVLALNGLYGITVEIENSFLETFEEFKDYVRSGDEARDMETIRKNVDSMMKAEGKVKSKRAVKSLK